MNIAFRIAFQDEISADKYLIDLISSEIKAQYHIPENTEPFASGIRSAVFENSLGQIVAFTNDKACKPAYKSVGKDSNILPEIYDLEEIELGGQKHCVIVMEKLEPLSESEKFECKEVDTEYWAWNKKLKEDYKKDPKSVNLNYPLIHSGPIEKAYLMLLKNMTKQNVTHTDLHPGNVAWGKDKELKLIDWESIWVPEYWV